MDKLDIVTLIFQEGRLRGVDTWSDTWTVHCARAVLWDPKSDLPDSKARASSATPHRPESQQCLCGVLWLRQRLVLLLTFGFYLGCSLVANCVRLLSDPMDCIRLLCPWDFPDWSRLSFPSPGDLPDPGIEPPCLLHCRLILYHWATRVTCPCKLRKLPHALGVGW